MPNCDSMDDEFFRAFEYAKDFYFKRLGLILAFSVPFIFAFLIPVFVSPPTFPALGGIFLRTGSIPELSIFDIIITAVAYGIALFLLSDTIVNINLIVRSRRTLTIIKKEILSAIGTYAMRIFYISTLMVLLQFVFQILTYGIPFQSVIYPLLTLVVSLALFFVAPAVVIDNYSTPHAIRRSIEMVLKKPFSVGLWTLFALLIISVVTVIGSILPSPFSWYFVLFINSLFVLPFLVVLQTQIYMEKYPLAR